MGAPAMGAEPVFPLADSPEQIEHCLSCPYPASCCTGRLYDRCRPEGRGREKRRSGRHRGPLYALLGPVISGEMSAADFCRITGYSQQQVSRARRELRSSQPRRDEGT